MSDELRDFCNRLHEQLREKDAEIERLRAERDKSYDMLRGPDGFECLLTEPENRTWWRDGKNAMAREKRFRMERFN